MCAQLIARITKHGWFDGDKKVFVFRDILDEAGKFLRVSYRMICAIYLHTVLVSEIVGIPFRHLVSARQQHHFSTLAILD